MLHDLTVGKLENEFRSVEPKESDIVFCFKDNAVFIGKNDDGTFFLPVLSDVKDKEYKLQYIFCFKGINCFLLMDNEINIESSAYTYEPVRTFRHLHSKDVCFAVMTAWHLFSWYQSNRFCGRCGAVTVHDVKERMMLCPKCGNMIFPKISPAVIIAVTNGDRLILSKYADRNYKRFALLAGYTEIGETLEQTVQREVMEEVGLKVKNIRYYKSQPWGIDGNILMGFYCDLDGDDTIHIDRSELSHADWYNRDSLPCEDDGISLTREMIRIFSEGKEPAK